MFILAKLPLHYQSAQLCVSQCSRNQKIFVAVFALFLLTVANLSAAHRFIGVVYLTKDKHMCRNFYLFVYAFKK